jgi:enoyl-CoA hydratase/carnithine racemase
MEKKLVLAQQNDHIGTLTINRPEKHNALSPELLIELHRIIEQWAKEGAIRVLVITGSGDESFSSGFDISSIPTEIKPGKNNAMKTENPLELALASIKHYPFPTIAMMNGNAFGAGLNLAICCDMRIASDHIRIGMPVAKLGLIYHPEGLKQFVRTVGITKTREIFLTAQTYSGDAIRELGIINQLVPKKSLAPITYDIASKIVKNAPLSLKGTKLMLHMLERTLALSDTDKIKAEALIVEGFNSVDLNEARTAFLEKRKPMFIGK